MFIDLFLLWIANLIWPDKPAQTINGRNSEDCANWIILDHMQDQGKVDDSNDPYLNEEYNDGPDW